MVFLRVRGQVHEHCRPCNRPLIICIRDRGLGGRLAALEFQSVPPPWEGLTLSLKYPHAHLGIAYPDPWEMLKEGIYLLYPPSHFQAGGKVGRAVGVESISDKIRKGKLERGAAERRGGAAYVCWRAP